MDRKIFEFYMLSYLLCIRLTHVSSASLEEAKELREHLLKGYSKYVRPVKDQSKSVDVYLSFTVTSIQEFDEVLERFSVVGAFFLYWLDENMVWNETDYSNITSVFMGYKEVWVPELILTNPSQKVDSFGKDWQLIRYFYTGVAAWMPGDLIKSTCFLDVRYFPFDIQECKVEMYALGYTVEEVKLVLITDHIDTDMLINHGSWNVLNTSVSVDIIGSLSRLTLCFRLERKSQFIIVNIILPILFLCLLNILVFVLPTESGERVSYAITVLLAIAVFMTIVSDTLPKKSEPLPIIAYFMMIDLIISALISVCTILNLHVFHRRKKRHIPKYMTCLYFFLSRTYRNKKTDESSSERNMKQDVTSLAGTTASEKENKQVEFNEIETPLKTADFKIATHKIDSEESGMLGNDITWQDISKMIDYILLVLFSVLTFTSFMTFLIITRIQTG